MLQQTGLIFTGIAFTLLAASLPSHTGDRLFAGFLVAGVYGVVLLVYGATRGEKLIN